MSTAVIEKGAIEKGAIEKGAIEKGAIEKGAIDNPADARRTTPRPRTGGGTGPALVDARLHAETAAADLVAVTADTVRALVPAAVLRPTEAVDHCFDLAEQALAAARRVCFEVAAILESGLDGAGRRAA